MDNADLHCNQHCNAGKGTHHNYCKNIPDGWHFLKYMIPRTLLNCLSCIKLHDFINSYLNLCCSVFLKPVFKTGNTWAGFLLALLSPWKERPFFCLVPRDNNNNNKIHNKIKKESTFSYLNTRQHVSEYFLSFVTIQMWQKFCTSADCMCTYIIQTTIKQTTQLRFVR